MADIELVIKIPKELKEALDNAKKENAFNYIRVYNDTIYNALKNGTPLPKGHGKLIDVDTIQVIELEDSLHFMQHRKGDEIDFYIDAPTIIEADKEQE